MKNEKNEPAYEAAKVRALIETGESLEKIEIFAQYLFEMFNIAEEDKYSKLIDFLSDKAILKDAIKHIQENKKEETLLILVSFLGLKLDEKENLKEINDLEWDEFVEIFKPEPKVINKLSVYSSSLQSIELFENQRVKHMNIPSLEENLEKEFETAIHLAPLLDVFGENRLIINCNDIETGLIAAKYLSLHFEGEVFDEEYECESDSMVDKIPILDMTRVSEYFNNSEIFSIDSFENGNSFQKAYQKERNDGQIPWWMVMKEIPLVIVVKSNCYYPNLKEYVSILAETHAGIYIVYINSKINGKNMFFMGDSNNKSMEELEFDSLFKTVTIEGSAIDSNYNQIVLKEFSQNELQHEIAEDVNVSELLKKLKDYRGTSWEGNKCICKALKKAISLKKNSDNILAIEDFDFIYKKGRKPEKNDQLQSEIDKMNKEMYGLEHVKKQVYDAVNKVKIQQKRIELRLAPSKSNNVIAFMGPPGTGKTEMAKFMGKIWQEEGLVSGGRFINKNAAELKGKYVGHSAPAVQALFDEFDIIFLDEIYSLVASHKGEGPDSFSQEAIAQLLVCLEEYSNDKLIIFAGYGGDVNKKDNKMKEFLDSNPGIASRISHYIDFPKYTMDEMLHIFENKVKNDEYELDTGWELIVEKFFSERTKSSSYGNARETRKLFQRIRAFQEGRIVNKELTKEELVLLTIEDIKFGCEQILEDERKINVEGNSNRSIIGF